MRISMMTVALAIALGAGCGSDAPADEAATGSEQASSPAAATATSSVSTIGSARDDLSPADIERGRRDPSWRRFATFDRQPASAAADTAAADTAGERWADIAPAAVNRGPWTLPLSGDVEGPSVLRTQILLDRAGFSPGVLDGRWGKNTEKAVYWLQEREELSSSGEVDEATAERLARLAGSPERLVVTHTLSEQDVAGPFRSLPEDVYERAEQPCLCYESLREKLGEVFHSTPELLEQLNPGVDLSAVQAGAELAVPNVERFHLDALPEGKYTGGGGVARIVISDGGHYLHALDEDGRILYHFPSTLGSEYAPSPTGDYRVTSITFDPTWHYQPELLTGEDPSRPDAVLPAGPNNAVGVVWMQLSADHYGIHGTSAPASIGYVTSHGCVRLTNWDAAQLAERTPPGTPVEFRDTDG